MGVEISFERLTQTNAEQCISCKEEAEIQEKSNIDCRSKSLGKSLQEVCPIVNG